MKLQGKLLMSIHYTLFRYAYIQWLQQVQGLTKVSVSLVTWSLALPLSRMKLLEDDEITALLYLTFVIRDSRR